MRRWIAPVCAVVIILLTIGLVVVMNQARERRALFDQAGVSQIYRENREALEKLDVVAPDGVGYSGAKLAFGMLADQLEGKYPAAEMVKLAKHQQPVIAMLGMELLARNGYFDCLVRFRQDDRAVHYQSGCTVNTTKPISYVLGEFWGLDEFMQDHAVQLSWLGVVLRWR
jgi:hypothetical protein